MNLQLHLKFIFNIGTVMLLASENADMYLRF